MIFKPELAALVVSGRKTETRRPVSLSLYGDKPCPYKPGRDYAVQPGRGKHAIGRILVTAVEQTVIAAMTPQQAAAEGFVDEDGHGYIEAFRAYWERLYGVRPALDLRVWRICFEPYEPPTPLRLI